MRILEVRFKNLNSLYGEWVIDFTHPEYNAGGIFALTGPTGAGKSTVLDALCLALYGATPRLGRITKSSNEIMSRQTGECYAEVLFESQAGVYRCHWEQRRARKSYEGNLQEPEHQIADALTNKWLETKKSLVGAVIEEKTGMDFERFTRSILLAQGSFDTFLKASAEDKSKILEQITGMEIYTEISRRIHERKREEQERLKWLRVETDGIVVLDAAQEDALEKELEATLIQAREQELHFLKTQQALAWCETIQMVQREKQQLLNDEVQIQSAWDAFQPMRVLLERAERAAALVTPHTILVALRSQQVDEKKVLIQQEATLLEATSVANNLFEALQNAEDSVNRCKETLHQNSAVIQRVRALDQQVGAQRKRILESEQRCAEEREKIKTLSLNLEHENDELHRLQHDEQKITAYLDENKADEWLLSGLAGIEEQRRRWFSIQEEINEHNERTARATFALQGVEDRLADAVAQRIRLQHDLSATEQAIEREKKEHEVLLKGRLLREYRAEKENVLKEMAYVRKIEELESYRSKLEEGVACPLCGATSHPFAQGNVPVLDALGERERVLSELIERAEQQELAIRERENGRSHTQNTLNEGLFLERALVNEKGALEKELNGQKERLDSLKTSLEDVEQSIYSKVAPLGEPRQDMDSLVEKLASRLRLWKEQLEKRGDIAQQKARVEAEVSRLQTLVQAYQEALAERLEHLSRLESELTETSKERSALYGENDPDVQEALLNEAVARAEEKEKQVRIQHAESWQKVTSLDAQIESMKKRVDERAMDLAQKEICFRNDLNMSRFSDEGDFTRAILSAEEKERLIAQAKGLDTALAEVVAKRKDREARLQQEEAKKLTSLSLDELEQKRNDEDARLANARTLAATLKHRLQENRSAKDKATAKAVELQAQERECHRWDVLHELIGSADGKKYRNFAQGLTFELMVLHANQQLEKMTDRYALVRDTLQPLALNVLDHYQAGEIRTTQNLSGGESFIVSLALALGLSKMASRKVRVDSLFLDEGFGTLDEESLDTALETLSGLQQDGKLIGVISHVSALKERIRAQIRVIPQSAGRSALSGPGCTRIK